MKLPTKFKNEERNASNFLSLSLRFAEENLEYLKKFYKKYTDAQIQNSKELTLIQRCVWTSLVVEIRKLLANPVRGYNNHSLREIEFFQHDPYKKIIDRVYGSSIIQKIIVMSNVFTIHLGVEKKFVSAKDISNSDLSELLNKLKSPIDAYVKYAQDKDPNPQVY